MPLALPVVAVGLLALLLALILTVLVTPYVEAAAREIPVVGGYIARAVGRVVDGGTAKVKAYARTFEHAVVGWLLGLRDAVQDLAEAMALYAVDLVDRLDHLTHVTVHEIVKAFVNPVRDLAHDAAHTAEQAQAGVDVLARELGEEIHGIEGTLHRDLDHLRDVVENVDLPQLGRDLGRVIGQVEDLVLGRIGDLEHYSRGELGQLHDQLGRIPLQQLLEGLALATGTAALVDTIAKEAGLDRAECRSKVRGICSTDPAAWERLLATVVPLIAFPGIVEIAEVAGGMARELDGVVRALGERG